MQEPVIHFSFHQTLEQNTARADMAGLGSIGLTTYITNLAKIGENVNNYDKTSLNSGCYPCII